MIWGNRIFTVIERVHLRFCKFVLGVPISACNLACYGELGRYPVEIRIKISLIKFWLRLATDYKLFKRSLSYESYLDLPPHMRVTLTRFRISAHHLHIETTRYACPSPVPVEERHCAHCVSTIEDEPNFLLNCPNYSNLRAPLLELCNHLLPSSHLSTMDQFIYLLTRKDRTF